MLSQLRFVTECSRAVPPDKGKPVERIQLAAMHAKFLNSAIKQKPSPTVRQAVIEYAVKTLEDRGIGSEYACSKRKSYWRNLDA